ncbi:MAG: DUF4080 domain-containing protein [Erysipelotrichaceae bacterium]
MKTLLTTLNAKYIHKNLALRLVYAAKPQDFTAAIKEYTIKDDLEKIANNILSHDVDVVCFSVYIWNIEETKVIIQMLKTKQPDLHIILGGPEVSFAATDLFAYGVDAILQGEAEYVMWDYLAQVARGIAPQIEGVLTPTFTTHHYIKESVERICALNPYFLDIDANDMDKRYFYFETSRGCPYNCEYCLSSTDNQVRLFPEDYVFSILEQIKDSKIQQVKFLDRTFNVSPQRALRVARYINEHCINQVFQFEIVAETLSEELLHFFTQEADKSRFRFEIGVQSFNQQTLRSVGRIQNNERLLEVIRLFQAAKLTMHVDLIAGLPYEDYASFQTSFDTLFALHPEEIQLGVLKLLKGTSLRMKSSVYGFIYEPLAPYTIVSTKWVDEAQLDLIKGAAMAVEKLYNSDKAKNTIKTILNLNIYPSAFALFVELGKALAKLPHPYQLVDLFGLFETVLASESIEVRQALIMMDYYRLVKNKPKRYPVDCLSLEAKKAAKASYREQFDFSLNEVSKMCLVDLYYHQGVTLQIIHLSSLQQPAKRFWLDQANNQWREIEE